jgi:hypothetical protein
MFTLQPGMPPDLFIVFDKSGSMDLPAPGGGGSLWQVMTQALNSVVMNLQDRIRFGLQLFPSPNSCDTVDVTVPLAGNNAAAIAAAIAAVLPDGATPTTSAIQKAQGYLAGVPGPNPKYLLLATDGLPNCGMPGPNTPCTCQAPLIPDPVNANACCFPPPFPCPNFIPIPCIPDEADAPAAIGAVMAAAGAGIKTFVIGIANGGGGTGAEMTLDGLAQAGGVPRAGGPPFYYPANSGAELEAALAAIGGQIASCTFQLATPPPDPTNIRILLNGVEIPRDPTRMNGWELDGPDAMGNYSITFYGGACNTIQTSTMVDVQAILGCPPIGKPGRR